MHSPRPLNNKPFQFQPSLTTDAHLRSPAPWQVGKLYEFPDTFFTKETAVLHSPSLSIGLNSDLLVTNQQWP